MRGCGAAGGFAGGRRGIMDALLGEVEERLHAFSAISEMALDLIARSCTTSRTRLLHAVEAYQLLMQ